MVVEALQAIQRSINELNDRCSVDLATLSKGGLFDTLFIYENWPRTDPNGWQAQLGFSFESQVEKLDYPLAAVISETPAELSVRLTYASEIFDARGIDELRRLQETLLGQLAPGLRWADLALMRPAEVELQNAYLHSPQQECSRNGVFHERFARQARLTPDRKAVACEGAHLTYRELDARADRLAALLQTDYQLRLEEPVAICLDRTLDVFVAMLAVMKAGGAYVPVDPAYPIDRISYIVKDSAARVVITHARHRFKLDPHESLLVLDDVALKQALVSPGDAPSRTPVESANLAYIIYTSGTTGQPGKGVQMVEHGSFCLNARRRPSAIFCRARSAEHVQPHQFCVRHLRPRIRASAAVRRPGGAGRPRCRRRCRAATSIFSRPRRACSACCSTA